MRGPSEVTFGGLRARQVVRLGPAATTCHVLGAPSGFRFLFTRFQVLNVFFSFFQIHMVFPMFWRKQL